MATDSRVLIVGIDEAGYGPILGPLVVSATAFEVPARLAESDLWRQLSESVTPKAGSRDRRIAVADSKKLFKSKSRDGLARLERSVLAMMGAWRGAPPHLRGLLGMICPDALDKMREYPWYGEANPALPRAADAAGVHLAAATALRDMRSKSIRMAGVWSEVLLEGHYNRLVGATRNKAVVLLGMTMRLVQQISDAYPDTEICFFIDKQGARDHYGPLLRKSFDGRRLKVLHEDSTHSAYELVGQRADWRISFRQSGESHHLAVALASCVSKYLRELFMGCFNDYWRRQAPKVRPTAGYYRDGLRFLGEIDPAIASLGIARDRLVRIR